jgi:hypothetical protein
MSHVPSGFSDLYIGPKPSSGNWWYNYDNGWPGCTVIQPQPWNTGALLVYVPGQILVNSNGSYTFWTNVSNQGGNSTYFNLQVSNT